VTGSIKYDFIFCRNLLIYFDRPTQTKALRRLNELLSPNGLLFVGPAELPLAMENQFISANLSMAFACRKAGHPAPSLQPRRMLRPLATPPIPSNTTPAKKPASNTPKATPASAPASGLEEIRQLADSGRLSEALEACQTYLREIGPCPHGYYLMGLVQDAAGDTGAMDCYRRALYLDPNHYETLLQMALLLEKNGDSTRAKAFKSRAQRLKLATK